MSEVKVRRNKKKLLLKFNVLGSIIIELLTTFSRICFDWDKFQKKNLHLSTIKTNFLFTIWTFSFIWFRVVPTSSLHFFFNFVLRNYSEIIELRCLPFCMASWTQCLSICSLTLWWLWSSKNFFQLNFFTCLMPGWMSSSAVTSTFEVFCFDL